jgi:hypothetical protein
MKNDQIVRKRRYILYLLSGHVVSGGLEIVHLVLHAGTILLSP